MRDSHLFGDGVNSVCVKLDKRPPQARIPPMKAREPGPSMTEVRDMASIPPLERLEMWETLPLLLAEYEAGMNSAGGAR